MSAPVPTRSERETVQPASAAMPSEELSEEKLVELTTKAMRAFEPLSSVLRYREADKWHTCDVMGMRAAVRAIWSEFAHILAEKERAERERDEFYRDGLKAEDKWIEMEARALAAEAALEKAEGFDFGNGITVESRGDGRWAVNNCGCVLNSDGDWEHEPRPSSRDDDFISRTRFDRDEAFRRAAAIRAQGE